MNNDTGHPFIEISSDEMEESKSDMQRDSSLNRDPSAVRQPHAVLDSAEDHFKTAELERERTEQLAAKKEAKRKADNLKRK